MLDLPSWCIHTHTHTHTRRLWQIVIYVTVWLKRLTAWGLFSLEHKDNLCSSLSMCFRSHLLVAFFTFFVYFFNLQVTCRLPVQDLQASRSSSRCAPPSFPANRNTPSESQPGSAVSPPSISLASPSSMHSETHTHTYTHTHTHVCTFNTVFPPRAHTNAE